MHEKHIEQWLAYSKSSRTINSSSNYPALFSHLNVIEFEWPVDISTCISTITLNQTHISAYHFFTAASITANQNDIAGTPTPDLPG